MLAVRKDLQYICTQGLSSILAINISIANSMWTHKHTTQSIVSASNAIHHYTFQGIVHVCISPVFIDPSQVKPSKLNVEVQGMTCVTTVRVYIRICDSVCQYGTCVKQK